MSRLLSRLPIFGFLALLSILVSLAGCAPVPTVATPTPSVATPFPSSPTPFASPTALPVTPTSAVTAAAGTPTAATQAPTAVSGAAGTPTQAHVVPNGNPAAGQAAIVSYGCGSCHTIPGVPGANGTAAPSLAGWDNQQTILGQVPNTPDNLTRFIENPQAVVPGATMPNLNVTATDARNIAAYLYTLK